MIIKVMSLNVEAQNIVRDSWIAKSRSRKALRMSLSVVVDESRAGQTISFVANVIKSTVSIAGTLLDKVSCASLQAVAGGVKCLAAILFAVVAA